MHISHPQPLVDQTGKCRLCAGELSGQFNLTILGKYEVQYYQCKECHSLQTEKPYWLEEAYGSNLSTLDTGAAQRNLHNLAACYAVSTLFNAKNVIDIGGGDGLLCRLLRDYGINCFVKDKWAKPTYAQGFTEPNFNKPDLVIAFEILEHFPNPESDLDEVFHCNSDLILISTAMYKNEQKNWWYLAPESGQHVFFYSEKALNFIAKKYNYKLIISGSFVLFAAKNVLTPIKTALATILLKRPICHLLKSVIILLPTPGVWKDHLSNKSKPG